MYSILQCRSCGNVLIARMGQKTKLCTYCNTRLNLHKVRVLAEASNSREASRIAMSIKDRNNRVNTPFKLRKREKSRTPKRNS